MYQGFVLDMLEDASVPEATVKCIEHAILKMAGFASAAVSSLPGFASLVMPSLRPDTPPDVLSALISALFGWKLKDKLVGMVVAWISNPLEEEGDKGSEDEEGPSNIESALFGFSLLDIILKEDPLRNDLLADSNCITAIINALHPYTSVVESRLRHENRVIPDQLMLMSLELYYRLLLHIAALSDEPVCYFYLTVLTFAAYFLRGSCRMV